MALYGQLLENIKGFGDDFDFLTARTWRMRTAMVAVFRMFDWTLTGIEEKPNRDEDRICVRRPLKSAPDAAASRESWKVLDDL